MFFTNRHQVNRIYVITAHLFRVVQRLVSSIKMKATSKKAAHKVRCGRPINANHLYEWVVDQFDDLFVCSKVDVFESLCEDLIVFCKHIAG